MGFLSFHERYYREKLAYWESRTLSPAELYDLKQNLKIIDDMVDEGYTNLCSDVEKTFSGMTRMRALLHAYGEEPFPVGADALPDTVYGDTEYELSGLLDELYRRAAAERAGDNPFLARVRAYSDWIPRTPDTAYVFLFRDALLPYFRFRANGCTALYPWLISRRFLHRIAGGTDVDDEIRLPVYNALESGHTDPASFFAYCLPRIRAVLKEYPVLAECLTALLRSIPEKRILVAESGYCGTIPLLLSALDERVRFTMYTTAPYLVSPYRGRIYCERYEDMRLFETLYSQDRLLRYASFRDGRFYVRLAEDPAVVHAALGEIRYML